ncbi:MAG: carbohydrate ABC transporter permease [Oscillospiraceae bacterium]|nr:carbohydrate ABC transporter permease [Oscillospiraceae bacterium]
MKENNTAAITAGNASAANSPPLDRKFKKSKIPFRDRFTKGKLKTFLGKAVVYALLIEITFIIIFPLLTKLSASLMSYEDMYDRTVIFIPRNPTLENIRMVLTESYFMPSFRDGFQANALLNTIWVSLLAASLQTLVCSVTGYGLAKLRSKLAMIVFGVVVLSIMIPPQVVLVPLYLKFRFMNIFGLVQLLRGKLGLMNTLWPIIILSITGFGFKNGLYIFIMRQFYKGVPEEIEEAAAIDGYGTIATYFRIVLPMARPMMITIFMFAFSWQWTDTFYSTIFFSNEFRMLANTIFRMQSLFSAGALTNSYNATMLLHTGVMLAIAPLIIIYIFAQRWIVAGIERSGLVG